ncbi:MAG: hypothetical protein RLN72_01990 [Henriciella sp.]
MRILALAALCAALGLAPGCAVFGAPADLPVAVSAAYLEREATQMEPHDSCGPEFVQESLPGFLRAAIEPLTDGPFRPACKRHDACYRLREQSQSWCDDRFREEMFATCNSGTGGLAYSIPGIGPPLCRAQGGLYYGMVNSTDGASAYEGMPGGVIANLRHSIVRRTRGEDEVKVCADVHNPTPMMQGYILELKDEVGKRIDKAPGAGQLKLRSDERGTLCTSTYGNRHYGLKDVANGIHAVLSADDPERYALWGDMVEVDRLQVVLD